MTDLRIALVIKGTPGEAAAAAAARGIPLLFKREALGETIGETSEDYRDKVGAWFAEQPASAPFPAGTLLLYQDA